MPPEMIQERGVMRETLQMSEDSDPDEDVDSSKGRRLSSAADAEIICSQEVDGVGGLRALSRSGNWLGF